MLNIPTPILGEVSAITIASPDLEKSFDFYKNLGFEEVMRMNFPFSRIQISDGALLIMLRQDNTEYIALTYYVKDIDKSIEIIENGGLAFLETPKPTDVIKKYLLKSPDGFNISFVHIIDGYSQPKGPTMLTMPQSDYTNPEKYANKTCGMFGEFAQPVKDLEVSISFWSLLGFNALYKSSGQNPWAILSDGLAIVGLHQTESFSKPTITFFAADMKSKIENLKQKGIDNYREQSHGNIVLTTPEGQEINLFSLGM